MRPISQLRRFRIDGKTAIALLVVMTAFISAVVAAQFDPGPEWFDTTDLPHVDAAIIGLSAGLLCALLSMAVSSTRSRGPKSATRHLAGWEQIASHRKNADGPPRSFAAQTHESPSRRE